MKDFYPTALGSATAGLVARVICHPIDTVKSRLQAGQSAFRAQEGIRTLFRGLGAVVVGGVPGVCIYMTSYEMCKDTLSTTPFFCNSSFATYLTAGMVAESICCIVFVPVDVIKERLQVQQTTSTLTSGSSSSNKLPIYRGSFDALLQICKQEGVRGIYKGYGATLLTYGPFSALYFLLYEENNSKDEAMTFSQTLGCAAVAGGVASAVTNPLDLAKLRMQIERGAPDHTRVQTKGVYGMMKKVYLQDGLRGLFRGAGARVLFHTPSTAITMALFEACKKKWGEILSY